LQKILFTSLSSTPGTPEGRHNLTNIGENMENLKFSVILPVYNVAPFLEECLQSLINQSYSNLEILCVNDGSPDNSLEILQKYAALDARIKVFDRENQGSGRSRNFGIEQSSGDYLSFIDPDDWVDRDLYKKLYDFIVEKSPDVVEFFYKNYYDATGEVTPGKHCQAIAKKCGMDMAVRESYSWKDCKNILCKFQSPCWNKVYKRSFILENKIEFSDHPTGQDIAFWHGVLFFAEKIDILHQELYFYRIRQGSAITSLKKKNLIYLFDQIDRTARTIERAGVRQALEKDFAAYRLRLVYDADKKSAPEYRDAIARQAKKYLSTGDYFKFQLKKNINRFLRTVFNFQKHFGGGRKTRITVLGIKFDI